MPSRMLFVDCSGNTNAKWLSRKISNFLYSHTDLLAEPLVDAFGPVEGALAGHLCSL